MKKPVIPKQDGIPATTPGAKDFKPKNKKAQYEKILITHEGKKYIPYED